MQGEYLLLCSGDNPCKHDVYLMGYPYTLKEVRLYAPGLHRYTDATGVGGKTEAEIILVHTRNSGGPTEHLLVCIPVKKNNLNPNAWFSFIRSIKSRNCKDIQSINTNGDWSLEQILPPQSSTPYYYYDATTFPWGSGGNCDMNGSIHYVVYDIANAANISEQDLSILSPALISNKIALADKNNTPTLYAYNPVGEGKMGADNKYYLNCKPTNVSKDGLSTEEDPVDDGGENIIAYVIFSLLGVWIFIMMIRQITSILPIEKARNLFKHSSASGGSN